MQFYLYVDELQEVATCHYKHFKITDISFSTVQELNAARPPKIMVRGVGEVYTSFQMHLPLPVHI